jgi:hypothetical protein
MFWFSSVNLINFASFWGLNFANFFILKNEGKKKHWTPPLYCNKHYNPIQRTLGYKQTKKHECEHETRKSNNNGAAAS